MLTEEPAAEEQQGDSGSGGEGRTAAAAAAEPPGRPKRLSLNSSSSAQSADGSLGLSVQSRCRNALYAISVARKLGAEAFLLPEDIVECKPKMLLLLVGSCMTLQHQS